MNFASTKHFLKFVVGFGLIIMVGLVGIYLGDKYAGEESQVSTLPDAV